MKLAILTCGMLPIPAVQGGAVENLTDFYLEYNDRHKLHDITVYSPFDAKAARHPALQSDVNHYVFIDVSSLWAKTERRLHKYLTSCNSYYNYFIEYYFEKAYKDIRKKDYDCIILENSPGHAYKLSQRGAKRIVLHLNNDLLHAKSRYHDEIFNGLDLILTCSDFIKRRVSTIQASDKIQTLYNAIDVSSFAPREASSGISRRLLGFKDDDFVIVYSGRINKDKGVSELIDAMHQLKATPNIKLMIVGGSFFGNSHGDDGFVRSLKERAEVIKDRIVFTGFIPYKHVPDYMHLADIAVLPSMWEEPFGLTITEALASGLPLVTTRSGGIPEICGGVATIVEKTDAVPHLVAAILDLYQHPEKRKQMAAASLERAKLFDKEAYAQNFFKALNTIF